MAWKPTAQSQLLHMKKAERYHEFKNLPKQSRQASILYPSHVPKERRVAMAELTQEGKRPPRPQGRLSDATRGATSPLGGQAVRTRR
jgi:hypothetical protein